MTYVEIFVTVNCGAGRFVTCHNIGTEESYSTMPSTIKGKKESKTHSCIRNSSKGVSTQLTRFP